MAILRLLLLALSPGSVPTYSVGNVYTCGVPRQGEGADLSQSDRSNDPTTADLIWRDIADPVTLPSATCAPFKFPAAVSLDRWREINSKWGEDGVLGDPGVFFQKACLLCKQNGH